MNINNRASKLRAKLDELPADAEVPAELTSRLEDIAEDKLWIQYGIYQLVADAMATVLDDGEVVYTHTPADVKAWCERADLMVVPTDDGEVQVGRPKINTEQLRDLVRMRIVPNAPLREAYLARQRPVMEVVADVHKHLAQLEENDGVSYGSKHFMLNGHPQTRHFERMLGLQPITGGGGAYGLRLFITYEVGVALMRALDMTPQEAGL
jgi:hypothetical protein